MGDLEGPKTRIITESQGLWWVTSFCLKKRWKNSGRGGMLQDWTLVKEKKQGGLSDWLVVFGYIWISIDVVEEALKKRMCIVCMCVYNLSHSVGHKSQSQSVGQQQSCHGHSPWAFFFSTSLTGALLWRIEEEDTSRKLMILGDCGRSDRVFCFTRSPIDRVSGFVSVTDRFCPEETACSLTGWPVGGPAKTFRDDHHFHGKTPTFEASDCPRLCGPASVSQTHVQDRRDGGGRWRT